MIPRAPLLFQDGLVYGADGQPPSRKDLLVAGETVTVGDNLQADEGTRVVPLDGLCFSPGWVDLHTHVFEGQGVFSVPPHQIGLATGVTTLVDAGSAGALNYRIFHERTIRNAAETILAYVNVSNVGIAHGHAGREGFIGEHCHAALHDPEPALAVLERFSSSIVGWKARLSSALAGGDRGLEQQAFRHLRALSERTGLPMMIHHAKSKIPPEEILAALSAGDVYTHLYHGYEDAIFDAATGRPLPEALEARQRGVVFDVGHGSGAFSWACAERACLQHGFWPDTISSDIHRYNAFWPVVDMATTMSKFLVLGVPVEKIISMVTGQVSRALRRPLAPADLTIFTVEAGDFPLADARGELRHARMRFVPLAVLKNGELTPCSGYPGSRHTTGNFAREIQNAAAF